MEAKEAQLEHALWSVVSLLEHVALIDDCLLKQIGENGFATPTQGLLARIRQVRAQTLQIRALIEETAFPDLDCQTGDSHADPA